MAASLLGMLYDSCRAATASACDWAADRLMGTPALTDCDVDLATVREGMDVVSACGQFLGHVDHVYLFANRIAVRTVDGHIAFVPREWVRRVTNQVHLRLNGVESRGEWAASRSVCAA